MKRRHPFAGALSAFSFSVLALCAGSAWAQQPAPQNTEPVADEIPRGETVLGRSRPELDPLGIRMGNFLFFPKLELRELYHDNIFSVESAKTDDFITIVSPGFSLQSDWNNHSFAVSGSADLGFHADTTEENYEDFNISASGRFDIKRDIDISASASYSALHEGRGSPDDVDGINPTEFSVALANIQYFHRLNRFNATLDGTVRKYDFDDARTSLTTINNDDRDRLESNISLRGGYEIIPEYEAFVRIGANDRSYDDNVDDNGFDRDSHGYEVVAGVYMDLGGIVFGDVFAGYTRQDYGDSSLNTIDGLTFGAGMTWNVTRLTTINGDITRVIEETTSGSASGFFATRIDLSVDHELLRNLILSSNLSATQKDYEGIEREDILYTVGVGAKYMLNRNFYGSLNYSYIHQDSDAPAGTDSDYRQNIFVVRLELQL